MSQSKPLIIPWLRDQINSGRYPGVTWMNTDKTEFCIPWKHALRQDSSSDDVFIFKAWAELNRERAQGDPSIWKRNFRSALRAKGFVLVLDKKNDAAHPHKVFRWPGDISPADGSQHTEVDIYREHIPLKESGEACFSNTYFEEGTVFTDPSGNSDILEMCMGELNIQTPDLQPNCQRGLAEVNEEVLLPDPHLYPIDGAMGGVNEHPNVEQFRSCMSRTVDGQNIQTFFRVVVYYRGTKVLEQTVENTAGLKLVYRPDMTQPYLDPQTGFSVVSLPSVSHMTDGQQAEMTQCILKNLGEGLELSLSGLVVLGQRRGDSRAFWSLCKFDKSKNPKEVSKYEPQPLFCVKYFFTGLQNFIENNGGECPSFSLFLCLGEKWPDPDSRPWEKKLVLVEVVLTSLEQLKLLAMNGGASSLQSVELQISLQEMMDQL